MLIVQQIKLPINHTASDLKEKIRKILKLNGNTIFTYKISKRSMDARKKPDLYYVYTCAVEIEDEKKVCGKAKNNSVICQPKKEFRLPACGEELLSKPPIIIGAGPAGLFTAYTLCLAGFMPILIERGKPVEERLKDVETFWKEG